MFFFKDSPARLAEYTAITKSTDFPLKFCTVRWLDNNRCISRALKIFVQVKKFVDSVKLPDSKSCKTIKEAVKDPLMICKLVAFKTVTQECEHFLYYY